MGARAYRSAWCLGVLVVILLGCGPRVEIKQETDAVGLPRPSAVYVYDFAVHPSEVQLDPGGPLARVRNVLSGGGDTGARELDSSVGSDANRLADKVANSLQQFFAKQGWTAPASALPTL